LTVAVSSKAAQRLFDIPAGALGVLGQQGRGPHGLLVAQAGGRLGGGDPGRAQGAQMAAAEPGQAEGRGSRGGTPAWRQMFRPRHWTGPGGAADPGPDGAGVPGDPQDLLAA
jgi:hypothetical protein